MNRIEFLRSLAGTTLAVGALSSQAACQTSSKESAEMMAPFSQNPLPYDYAALEPSIDAETMNIHYNKHAKGYVDKLNAAVKSTEYEKMSLNDMLKNISKAPEAIRNNGGGHWNHSFFWNAMAPGKGGTPTGAIADAINGQFGSFDSMKEAFGKEAAGRFGSGWAWLVMQDGGKLALGSTPNQDNPLMDVSEFKGTPILGLDVWEHAYYLKYQNKRGDYVGNFWDVVNWDRAAELMKKG